MYCHAISWYKYRNTACTTVVCWLQPICCVVVELQGVLFPVFVVMVPGVTFHWWSGTKWPRHQAICGLFCSNSEAMLCTTINGLFAHVVHVLQVAQGVDLKWSTDCARCCRLKPIVRPLHFPPHFGIIDYNGWMFWSRCSATFAYIPYSQKNWRGVKFGGLAVLETNRQSKIGQYVVYT